MAILRVVFPRSLSVWHSSVRDMIGSVNVAEDLLASQSEVNYCLILPGFLI